MSLSKFSFYVLFLLIFGLSINKIFAQDPLYFCEKYTNKEIGVSNRFTTGNLTVMVKLEQPLEQDNVIIELDKLNCTTGKFEYFDSRTFITDPKWTYIHFDKINFGSPGIYRVFLLDPDYNTLVSGLIEIVRR